MTTLEAIDASIEKWKQNAEIDRIECARTSMHDCPLCLKFHPYKQDETCFGAECHGCPIMEYTGFSYCSNTPYDEASEAEYEDDLEAFKKAARDEVEFLQKVRQDFLDNQGEND